MRRLVPYMALVLVLAELVLILVLWLLSAALPNSGAFWYNPCYTHLVLADIGSDSHWLSEVLWSLPSSYAL